MAPWPWIGHELPRPLLPALHSEDVAQSAFLKLCFTRKCPASVLGHIMGILLKDRQQNVFGKML